MRPERHRRTPSADAEALHDAAQVLADIWMRSNLVGEERVSASQWRALAAVGRAGSLSIGQLAATLGAMVSSASRLCDRLVAAGYLTRDQRPENRRQIFVTLTLEGRHLLDEVRSARIAELEDLLEPMSGREIDDLLNGLRAMTDASVRRARRQG